MSAYIYTVFERDSDCTECMGERQLLLATSKKWVAVKFIKEALMNGFSPHNYDVFRSRDSHGGTAVMVDSYQFIEVDPGEVE